MMSAAPMQRDVPGVIAPPPLILLGHILVGLALDWLWPAPFLPPAIQYAVGAALIVLAGALAGTAIARFLRAGTNVPTRRPATVLVIAGPYRFSRNPIYVGMIVLLLGIGFAVDSLWIIALAAPFALVLRYGVIAREERYLEAKFADAYRAYRARVPRWM
jgi:protein-S-isoprenylcysteine O-methyltransferase Ste14